MKPFLNGSIWKRRCIPATPDGQPDELLCLGTEEYNERVCVLVRGVNEIAGGIAVFPDDLEADYDLIAEGEEPPVSVLEGFF